MTIDAGDGTQIIEMLEEMSDRERKTIRHECPSCQGVGKVKSTKGWKCQKCKGKGWIADSEDDEILCPVCNGDQVIYEKACQGCRGSGSIISVVKCIESEEQCFECGGTGHYPAVEIMNCADCNIQGNRNDLNGFGETGVVYIDSSWNDRVVRMRIFTQLPEGICPTCNDTGEIEIFEVCPQCYGSGELRIKKLVEIVNGDEREKDWLSSFFMATEIERPDVEGCCREGDNGGYIMQYMPGEPCLNTYAVDKPL